MKSERQECLGHFAANEKDFGFSSEYDKKSSGEEHDLIYIIVVLVVFELCVENIHKGLRAETK